MRFINIYSIHFLFIPVCLQVRLQNFTWSLRTLQECIAIFTSILCALTEIPFRCMHSGNSHTFLLMLFIYLRFYLLEHVCTHQEWEVGGKESLAESMLSSEPNMDIRDPSHHPKIMTIADQKSGMPYGLSHPSSPFASAF